MKILLISGWTLPRPGGTSVIVENLVQNFKKDQLVVLSGKTLFQKAYDRPSDTPEFIYHFTEIDLFGRGARYFKALRKLRFNSLVSRIKSVCKKHKIDYIIGVYPDYYYCYASVLAAKALKLPFSSYFHNTFIENTAQKVPNAHAIQKEIFDYSDHIFVMSEGMQNFYEEKYKLDKFIPLVHTFNEYPDKASCTGIPGSGKSHYKLVAIGNFNPSNMDATVRFANAIKDDDRFSLSLYTHVPKILLKQRGLDPELIIHRGFLDPDQVHDAIQEFDLCLLTHGFKGNYGEIEYKTIFPTRTIPLLLSGKPIVAHSPKNSFLNYFIEKNKCAELIDTPDDKAIIKGLEKVINSVDYQKELVKASDKTARQFYGPEVVSLLLDNISRN